MVLASNTRTCSASTRALRTEGRCPTLLRAARPPTGLVTLTVYAPGAALVPMGNCSRYWPSAPVERYTW